MEYLAREEKFVLDGDRKELVMIKQELDQLRSGLHHRQTLIQHPPQVKGDAPPPPLAAPPPQATIQFQFGRAGDAIVASGAAVAEEKQPSRHRYQQQQQQGDDVAASVDSLSAIAEEGRPTLPASAEEQRSGSSSSSSNSRRGGYGGGAVLPINDRTSGDGLDVRGSAGALALLQRQGEELRGLSGYQPGDPLLQQIDRHKPGLEQKEYGM